MAVQRNSPASFEAGEALSQYRRVVPTTGGTVKYADATDAGIGATLQAAASGSHVAVRLDENGTQKVEAAGAIAINEQCYAAANGRVAATGTIVVGTTLQAASAAGSVIEMLPHKGTTAISSSSSSSAGA